MTTYQEAYSQREPSLFDINRRTIKARKIFSVIKDFSVKEPSLCVGLDIGCSAGINTNFLGSELKDAIGIEIDEDALKYGYSCKKPNVHFLIGDAIHLPFDDEIFDIVICNHVYEHVPDAKILMDEIFRILKPGGFCYFGAANRFIIIEPHYRLPFLSWFPKTVANFYLLFLGKKSPYYENLRSYYGIKKLISRFSVTDYTLRIIRNPEQFNAEDVIGKKSLIRYLPESLLYLLIPIIPIYIFVLSKPHPDLQHYYAKIPQGKEMTGNGKTESLHSI
jgi:SAM-dependent methyltransferase